MKKTFAKFLLLGTLATLSIIVSQSSWAYDPNIRDNVPTEKIALAQKAGSMEAAIYVSCSGDDAWSGRLSEPNADRTDGPVRTIHAAQLAVRQYRAENETKDKPTIVRITGGLYSQTEPLLFTAEDSGSSDSPIIWTAACGETVRISAGQLLPKPTPVTDSAVLERLQPEVREKIVQYDLSGFDSLDLGQPDGTGTEFFFNDQPMTLSRYPNDGFMKIRDVVKEGTTPIEVRGTTGIAEGKFYYDDPRPSQWGKESDIWFLGYWYWDWFISRQKCVVLDTENQRIEMAGPDHIFGYRAGQWFYAYNLLCEIDQPGEYYIDRETRTLYFYPPEENAEAFLTNLPNVLKVNASHLIFSGITFEGAKEGGIIFSGKDMILYGGEVKNCGGCGFSGGNEQITVYGVEFDRLGANGVSVAGGDQKTLTPGNINVINNKIHDYARVIRMYAAGISFNGVGIYIANNRISDAPHCAIQFAGNENLIEKNEITQVCLESNDAGAIYCGRNWTMRGNCVKNNYLHDIDGFEHRGCVGVYLDDMFSSCDIIGNLFVRVTRAAMIGGGRNNHVDGNIFVDCKPSLHIDARALGWCYEFADSWIKEAEEKGTISGIYWNQPPYSERYPELASILENNPKAPVGNFVTRNIVVGLDGNEAEQGQWKGDSVEDSARELTVFENNLLTGKSIFVDSNSGDYHLKTDAVLPEGFEPIPMDAIGLLKQE